MIEKNKYIQLLNETLKDKNGNSKIQDLMTYIQENKPKSLFHYRRCTEYSIETFREGKLYFNTANNFNDPYDCLVYCDVDKIYKSISNMTKLENIQKLQKNINEELFINNKPIQMPKQKAEEIINLLKGKDIQSIFDSIPSDYFDILKQTLEQTTQSVVNDYMKYFRFEMPLVCLSESYNDILMWSHYADNHKGFVIEYDTDTLRTDCMCCPNGKNNKNCIEWKQVMLLPILYTNERYDATNFIYDNVLMSIFNRVGLLNVWNSADDFAQYKINIYKHESWSYEKEWRLQLYRTNGEKFINAKPIAVYLGCRISKCYEDILVKYALAHNIKIYKMNENPNKLKYNFLKQQYIYEELTFNK